MAGQMTRQEAREHVFKTVQKLVDQMIPEDEKLPVKDGIFREWEEMADRFDREATGSLMEALAGVSEKAKLEEPGVCRHCGSWNVRWLFQEKQQERQSEHGVVVLPRQPRDAGHVTGLFPPQERDWQLDPQVHLTPQAAERVCRGGAQEPFDHTARNVNADWGTCYDGKQMQRWVEHYGQKVVQELEQERQAYKQGKRPEGPPNGAEVLAVGMDGGRLQERQKDPVSDSHWHEDKVLSISSYRKEPGEKKGDDPVPVRLVTTYLGTMQESRRFGELARVEAERRGIREAREVVVIGDGAAWIDTEAQTHFTCHARIIDFYHVVQRLGELAKALYPANETARKHLADRLEGQLYDGKAAVILRWMARKSRELGKPRETDPPEHPRRIVAEHQTYLQRHQSQMDYPAYRARGWPIGSGVTESGVKLFNKRVKGTEQYWNESGAEAVLAMRALWLSQDDRWNHYWKYGRLLRKAA